MSKSIQQNLWNLLVPVVEEAGFELVDLHYVREKGWMLRLYIDRPNITVIPGIGTAPGESITLDECTQVSRQISALLDVEDIIPHKYTLQVSSPGVQRPLRTKEDYKKFRECPIRIKTFAPIQAQGETDTKAKPSRNILGMLVALEEDHVTLDSQGKHFEIPFDAVASARLEPDMERWMRFAKEARAQREKAGEERGE